MSFNVIDTNKPITIDRTVDKTIKDVNWILYWANVALDATGRDHAEAKEQLGPCRASRAMAIVFLAMFEAYNAIDHKYESYLGVDPNPYAGVKIAIAKAAHDTLVSLFPAQEQLHNDLFNTYENTISDTPNKTDGITLGCLCANKALLYRAKDHSDFKEQVVGVDYIINEPPGVGEWTVDPISQIPVALGSLWPDVSTFVLENASQFRAGPFPSLISEQYSQELQEARELGQDISEVRTADQTEIGIFWAYDGRPSLCAPPRLYNQIAITIGRNRNLSLGDMARLLAILNVGMGDTAIAAWDSKYFYKIWRPIHAMRYAYGNDGWAPLGAPSSNGNGPNFTPPFPTYVSGHATFGGCIFQILRRFFETDNIAFSFTSDEFNGETKDNQGNIRPVVTRHYNNLSEPELENGLSRIYLGIHFRSDSTEGIAMGNLVGDYVYDHIFRTL